jgi:hypothetical protein
VDGIAEPLEDVTISYIESEREFKTFGLAGINQLAILMHRGMASICTSISIQQIIFSINSDDEEMDESEEYNLSTRLSVMYVVSHQM